LTISIRTDTVVTQYTRRQVLAIWFAAAIPMGLLGWIVAPALGRGASNPFLIRTAVLTAGLAWQFVLVLWLIHREAGELRWSSAAPRLWLQAPRAEGTDRPAPRLWCWLIPIVLLTAAYDLIARGPVDRAWVSIVPWLAEPPGFAFGSALAAPDVRAQLAGAWGVLALFILTAILNTVLGEELLFRGLLLPRMAGAFGRFDALANGLLFGAYHLHQPWGMFSSALTGILFFALPARHFRSAWFGVTAHSGQSVYLTVLILGLVLGLG
jgi:membrane protease YdiL (CAAX protease family)